MLLGLLVVDSDREKGRISLSSNRDNFLTSTLPLVPLPDRWIFVEGRSLKKDTRIL